MFYLVNKSHCSLVCFDREEDDKDDEVEFTTKLGNLQYIYMYVSQYLFGHLKLKCALIYLLTNQDCV